MRMGSKPAWTGIYAASLNEDEGGQHQERRLCEVGDGPWRL